MCRDRIIDQRLVAYDPCLIQEREDFAGDLLIVGIHLVVGRQGYAGSTIRWRKSGYEDIQTKKYVLDIIKNSGGGDFVRRYDTFGAGKKGSFFSTVYHDPTQLPGNVGSGIYFIPFAPKVFFLRSADDGFLAL